MLWARRVIEFIFHGMHQLWTDYTNRQHLPPGGQSVTQIRLTKQVSDLQSKYAQICPHFSHEFFLNLETGSYSVCSLRNWLNLHQQKIDQAICLQRQADSCGQRLLQRFLHLLKLLHLYILKHFPFGCLNGSPCYQPVHVSAWQVSIG